MSEYVKISDVIKVCKRLHSSYGTTAFFNAPVFEDLLRTVAVELPEPPPENMADALLIQLIKHKTTTHDLSDDSLTALDNRLVELMMIIGFETEGRKILKEHKLRGWVTEENSNDEF